MAHSEMKPTPKPASMHDRIASVESSSITMCKDPCKDQLFAIRALLCGACRNLFPA
jgi:hypothetical protein